LGFATSGAWFGGVALMTTKRRRRLATRVAPLAAGYLIGSIPAGYVVARLGGIEDIRRVGSGNIGATNVLRTLGWKYGLVVLGLDAAKGILGALVMRWAGGGPVAQTLGGLSAFVGHLWPFTLGFKGGRGVATGFGLMTVLDPPAGLVGAGVFVAVVASTRYVSLGSMSAACLAVLTLLLRRRPVGQVLLCALGAVAIVWRHRPNIDRLLAGTESRFSWRGRTAPTA
jgi:glycerol-3-phosphate acyltransferase PlsY